MIVQMRERGQTTLDGHQLGLILALEDVLPAFDLTLVCPACAQERGDYTLDANNDGYDLSWKVDCQCRRRQAVPSSAALVTQGPGPLLLAASRALILAKLAVRCRRTVACLKTAPEWTQAGDQVVMSCRCGERTFPRATPSGPAPAAPTIG